VAGQTEIYSFGDGIFGRRHVTSQGLIMSFGLPPTRMDPLDRLSTLEVLSNIAYAPWEVEKHLGVWSISPNRAAALHERLLTRWPIERDRTGEFGDWYDQSVYATLAVLERAMTFGERVARTYDPNEAPEYSTKKPSEGCCSFAAATRISGLEAAGLAVVALCAWRARRIRRRPT
jgi:hypothetical protein